MQDLRAEEGEGHKDDEEEEEEENNKAEEKEKSEDMEGQSLQGQSQSTAEPLQVRYPTDDPNLQI